MRIDLQNIHGGEGMGAIPTRYDGDHSYEHSSYFHMMWEWLLHSS